ncbi:MAG: homoserine O-acetyltransferase [Chloroflexi bacterium]|nr:homoserine O-acetyltransferase [Chloroflexota bacterium]
MISAVPRSLSPTRSITIASLAPARRLPRRPLPLDAGSTGTVETRFCTFGSPDAPFRLEHGGSLGPVTLAYETYGTLAPDGGNAILACHALSGDAHAAGWSVDQNAPSAVDGMGADEKGIRPRGGLGWWDGMIGPGKAFDTDKYFVICSNVIGSCRGSTGPASIEPMTGRPYGSRFPLVTVGDMVNAERELLRHLGVERLLAVTGGSLGGNQALQWTLAYPDMVAGCVAIATCASLSAQGIAFNEIGRQAIMADPNWRGGEYYDGPPPALGLAVARMIGHVTYLSEGSMEAKFGRQRRGLQPGEVGPDRRGQVFEVESYLRHQGQRFVERFDPNSYLAISRAIDEFDLAEAFGDGSLSRAFEQARARFLVLSFSSDWLYPPHESQRIVRALQENDADVTHRNLKSGYGHDAFLLEEARQTSLIRPFLSRLREQTRTS